MITEFLYISREGDNEIVHTERLRLEKLSKAELVDYYNRVAAKGFFGPHVQGLHVAALHFTMRSVFGDSPIKILGHGRLLQLGGQVSLNSDEELVI